MQHFAKLVSVLASVVIFTGVAQAVTFSVTDVTVTPSYLSGSDKTNFLWSVSSSPTGSFSLLNVGDSWSFTYGTFSTNDFPISNNDLGDYLGNSIGNFAASFIVSPPGVRIPENGTQLGVPSVTGTIKSRSNGAGDVWNGGVWVDFDNTPLVQSLGSEGLFTVTFNDINRFTSNGTYDLTATIQLVSGGADMPAVPVPEPRTLVAMGVGIFGLAIYSKRCRNAGFMAN